MIATYDRQNAVWEKANTLEDEEMLHKICGPDGNKCTDMIAEDFQYHKECMTNYLTKRLHSKEKTTVATPYDAALNQLLISQIDEHLFKEKPIFFITAFRDEFRRYLESHDTMLPHTDLSP